MLSKKNNAISKIATVGGIDNSTNPVTFALTTGEGSKFPASNFKLSIENEIMLCTSRTGDSVTCTRAQESTSMASHAQNTSVELRITAGTLEEYDARLSGADGTVLDDSNGNEVLKKESVASAVNELTIKNAATTNAVEVKATGGDTNIDLKLVPKGTGGIKDKNDDYLTPYASILRQSLVNGNQDVFQRGTSIALSATGYTSDRWLFVTGSGQAHTISRQDGTGVVGSLYSLRVQRNSGQLASNNQLHYALETVDSIKLRGKKLTLSFWAKCGANFSPTSGLLPVAIVTGKGTDQRLASFTSTADAVSEDKVLTTSWQKFTITTTAVIASDITQIGLRFTNNTTGTAGVNDWFEITQVQLCAGDVALPFQPKSYEEELRACQRFCQVISASSLVEAVAMGIARSTTVAGILLPLKQSMRISPALTATASDWQLYDGNTAASDVTAIQKDDANTSGEEAISIKATVASGLTQFRPYTLISDGTAGRGMIIDAEL